MQQYIYRNQKKLRCGYTTGSCATAAAKAAVIMLLRRENVERVSIGTPKGIPLTLEIVDISRKEEKVRCGVRKDAGDDSDVTDGIIVYATVRKIEEGIVIEGGSGIGRITKPGLEQKVGEAAINSTPRRMIQKEIKDICEKLNYEGGIEVVLSIPRGEELAKKTFNPRLGISGGLSILGTSGIVEPMSEQALVETIRKEISIHVAMGQKNIVLVPGNYGETFLKEQYPSLLSHTVKCSNFIGETIDLSKEFELRGMLFVGHIGKLGKLAFGIMNTHSKYADARMEALAIAGLEANLERSVLYQLLACNTTDEALGILQEKGEMESVMQQLMQRIASYLNKRAYEGLQIEAMLFSNQYGLLGETKGVEAFLKRIEGER